MLLMFLCSIFQCLDMWFFKGESSLETTTQKNAASTETLLLLLVKFVQLLNVMSLVKYFLVLIIFSEKFLKCSLGTLAMLYNIEKTFCEMLQIIYHLTLKRDFIFTPFTMHSALWTFNSVKLKSECLRIHDEYDDSGHPVTTPMSQRPCNLFQMSEWYWKYTM